MCRGSSVPQELAGDEPISVLQLRWATHTAECREVARAQLLRDSPGICWRRGVFAVPVRAVAGLDLETQGGEVVVPLADGPSGVAHPLDSCAVVFTEIAADLEGGLFLVCGCCVVFLSLSRRFVSFLRSV